MAVIKKSDLSEKNKAKWMAVMQAELISSEESISSNENDDNDEEEKPLIIKTIPWRAPKVDKLFKVLDDFSQKEKSAQSKKQTKQRIVSGIESTRHIPENVPQWALIIKTGDN